MMQITSSESNAAAQHEVNGGASCQVKLEVQPLHQQQQRSQGENGQKVVRFDDQVKTISYGLDARGRKQNWYRKTDYKRFHHEKKETLRHFRHAQSKFQRIQEDIFCLRGFEACLSARAVQQRLLHKVAALQAVLETQFDQMRRGIYDPRRIQSEYHRVSVVARNQALERAALDAAEVQEDQHQPREESPEETASLKNHMDRLLRIKAGAVPQTSLRSAASGPLRLRKTVPSTA